MWGIALSLAPKVLGFLKDRIFKNPKTSIAGVAAGGVVGYVLKSFGCTLPVGFEAWAAFAGGLIAALPSLLAKDK